MKQRKGQDLFTFTYEIHRLLDNRLVSATEIEVATEFGHEVTRTVLPWTEGAWADLCGKMNKLFKRLARQIERPEWVTEEDIATYCRNGQRNLDIWDDLHGMLCHLEERLEYFSDRWGVERAAYAKMLWERILGLKAEGQELRSHPAP